MKDIDVANALSALNAIERNLKQVIFSGDVKFDKELFQEFHVDVINRYLQELRDIVCKQN